MNDLVSLQNKAMETIKKFQQVESFQDLKLWLFQGKGQSRHTYAAYLEAVKQFYTLFDGLHPLQWTPAHIEEFYDHILSKNSRATADLRIAGLKKICSNIKELMPFWENPFDIMSESVKSKLTAGERGKRKLALYKKELQATLEFLKKDTTLKGKQNYAMVLTLVTTGLRAAELCSLNYNSLEHDPDTDIWYLKGIGKGNKPFYQEVHPDAVNASLEAFRARFKRDWKQGDALFWSLENYHGKPPVQMNKAVLWRRLHDIGLQLKAQGLIRKEIEFSAHLFRRTYLTLLSREGMKAVEIQRHSRHSNIETLIDHYIDTKESTKPYLDKILGAA